MEIIDIINKVVRFSLINVGIYFIFVKLINYTKKSIMKFSIIIILSVILAIVQTILVNYVSDLLTIIIIYILYSIVISKVTNNKFSYSYIITNISLAIVYSTYIISVIMSGITIGALKLKLEMNNSISLILIMLFTFLILYRISKIKRFNKGITFLQNKEKINNIGIIGTAIISVILIFYSRVGESNNLRILLAGIIMGGICIIIWIRRRITKYYKQKIKERTIEELQNEIKTKDEEISRILEENKNFAVINHKYSNRINALERFSAEILSKPAVKNIMKEEYGEGFEDFEKQIKEISKEYSNEIKSKIKHENKLEKTGVFGVDNILEYMKGQAEKDNIELNLKINGNINYMVENIIDESKLETLLGDHIKDAIIAINSSKNTYKEILVIIGIIDDCYEVCIYDTGIEFEINTLQKLGQEQITTHKKTGGSGIGFMTTFETLKVTKASLIIEEKHPISNTDYTKAVRIRFDGKNEYKINSYREDEIKKESRNILFPN